MLHFIYQLRPQAVEPSAAVAIDNRELVQKRMQRSSFFGFVCVVALVAVVLLSVVSGAEANCSLVGKWRSFDNSEHYHINITFDFQADNTYQANVLAPSRFISTSELNA